MGSTGLWLCVDAVKEEHLLHNGSVTLPNLIRPREVTDQSRLSWYVGAERRIKNEKVIKKKSTQLKNFHLRWCWCKVISGCAVLCVSQVCKSSCLVRKSIMKIHRLPGGEAKTHLKSLIMVWLWRRKKIQAVLLVYSWVLITLIDLNRTLWNAFMWVDFT